ncbi:MAG TPA: glycosyltransferase family 39 protein, partial [Ardenticatenaceae bacterium]|nr:glycosyltransferase family 39 protein [Ardenticatenaceae bacterium]
ILDLGVPIMPSGVLYTRGLLASYVEAAFLALFGFTPFVARLPNILFGLATIVAVYAVGRRQFGPRVGLIAAALTTLAPEAIIWSGRARFYAQLQLFVLLAAWAAYESISGRRERHWLFAALFVLALFSQEETILIYPAIILAALLWRGIDYFRRPRVLAAHAVCLVAMAVRFAIEKLGQPGYFETIQAQRPYVYLSLDILGALGRFSDFFVAADRIPLTLLVSIALSAALIPTAYYVLRTARGRGRELSHAVRSTQVEQRTIDGPPSPFHQATLFNTLLFLVVFGIIVLFVGETWRELRYLFILVPFWFLLAAAGAVLLLERFVASPTARDLGAVALAGMALLLFTPAAHAAVTKQVEGYDLALEWIARERRPGDVVLTPQPPACAIILGPCDYYAVQKFYEEYVIRRDGVLVDRWTGVPLLNSVGQLEQVIRSHPTTYFLIDVWRLATRYEPDFIRVMLQQSEVAFQARGISVLRARGWTEPTPLPVVRRYDPPLNFDDQLGLQRVELSGDAFDPGDRVDAVLTWTGIGPVWDDYNVSLQLFAPDGTRVAQHDGPPADGVMPTWLFGPTEHPDFHTLALPGDLASGHYRLEASVYNLETGTRLPRRGATGAASGESATVGWLRVGPAPTSPEVLLDAEWEGGIRLVGHDTLPGTMGPGESLDLRLVWTAEEPQARDYTVFVQVLGPDGQLVAQSDRQPEGGSYPTSAWTVREHVADTYRLPIPPDAVSGTYTIIAGLYTSEGRLPVFQGSSAVSDHLAIGTVRVD